MFNSVIYRCTHIIVCNTIKLTWGRRRDMRIFMNSFGILKYGHHRHYFFLSFYPPSLSFGCDTLFSICCLGYFVCAVCFFYLFIYFSFYFNFFVLVAIVAFICFAIVVCASLFPRSYRLPLSVIVSCACEQRIIIL